MFRSENSFLKNVLHTNPDSYLQFRRALKETLYPIKTMSFLSKLFTNNNIPCPRCLGKGQVDQHDIQRLKKELYWKPGTCALCNGKRAIDPKILSAVTEDETYLTTDLSESERNSLLENNPIAKSVATNHMNLLDEFIDEVYKLHTENKLTPEQIADYIDSEKLDFIIKSDTVEYVKKVIKLKMGN